MKRCSFISFFLIMPLFIYGQSMDVQGHRGSQGHRPENTLPSFAIAIEAGVDAIELDLLVSKDGDLIIHHDFFINKALCTLLDGRPILQAPLIHSLTVAEIKKFDCGSKKNPEFPKQILIPGTQIPTLDELLAWIRNSPHSNAKKVQLNLEIKREPSHPEYTISPNEFAKKLLDKIQEAGFAERVYYSSFDPEVLFEVRKLNPKARIGFLFDEDSLDEARKTHPEANMDFFVKIARALRAEVFSPHHSFLNRVETVRALQQSGFRVIPWTVNEENRWSELIEMGVDGIISDYPQELIQFLKNKKLRS